MNNNYPVLLAYPSQEVQYTVIAYPRDESHIEIRKFTDFEKAMIFYRKNYSYDNSPVLHMTQSFLTPTGNIIATSLWNDANKIWTIIHLNFVPDAKPTSSWDNYHDGDLMGCQ